MLGSFWSSRRDTSGGDTTPKAPIHSHPDKERNPFESTLSSVSGRHSRENSRSAAAAGGGGNSSSNTSNGTNARDFASPAPLQHTAHNASTASLSSSHSSSSHGLAGGLHHHGLPAGLRTPTLQKSFVLPEVTSSVNATGLHAPNTSSKTATAALHQSPMYPQSSSSAAAGASNSSGRNTPTRTAHQHTQAAPYPNPKEHHHPHNNNNASPKSKSHPDFKLSQPPDSKAAAAAGKTSAKAGGEALGNPVNQSFPSTNSDSTTDASSSSSTRTNQIASTAMTSSTGSSAGSSSTGQPSTRKRGDHGSSSLKGKLTVKFIEARNLVTPEANIRPYVVATFEQNEFVSREAINEHEEDARGEPVSPRTSSHLRSSQRSSGPKSNGDSPTEANGGSSVETSDAMDTSTASAYHPVWKHEVAL